MPARPQKDTRRELLELGVAALLEVTPATLLSAVGVKEIARRAGVGAPALYHHFGSLESFAEAVVRRVYDPDAFPVAEVTGRLGDLAQGSVPVEAAKHFHRGDFSRLRQDPLFRVRLGLWALGGSALDTVYGDLLRAIDARIGAAAAALFDSWGRELRPPVDMATYVAAQTAMISGSVVRHLVDPAAMDVERFAQVSSALTIPLLRPKGDARNLEDRLTELNRYPRGAALRTEWADDTGETSQRLLSAGETTFDRVGYAHATVRQVARTAGVSVSTLYLHFAGLAELAVTLVATRFTQSVATATSQHSSDAEPSTNDVRVAIETVAEFCSTRTDYIGPYAAYLALGPSLDDPLVGYLADRLGEDRELAGSVLLLVVSTLVTSPGAGSTRATKRAMALVAGVRHGDGSDRNGLS